MSTNGRPWTKARRKKFLATMKTKAQARHTQRSSLAAARVAYDIEQAAKGAPPAKAAAVRKAALGRDYHKLAALIVAIWTAMEK